MICSCDAKETLLKLYTPKDGFLVDRDTCVSWNKELDKLIVGISQLWACVAELVRSWSVGHCLSNHPTATADLLNIISLTIIDYRVAYIYIDTNFKDRCLETKRDIKLVFFIFGGDFSFEGLLRPFIGFALTFAVTGDQHSVFVMSKLGKYLYQLLIFLIKLSQLMKSKRCRPHSLI